MRNETRTRGHWFYALFAVGIGLSIAPKLPNSLVTKRGLAMSNPMKYIKDLEAAGFQRNQAEAQVQMVLDAIEGDLVTKSDFAVFREHIDRRFAEVNHRFSEIELRLVVKLGFITVTTTSIAVAVLTWLNKL